jgi:hypothetical protein
MIDPEVNTRGCEMAWRLIVRLKDRRMHTDFQGGFGPTTSTIGDEIPFEGESCQSYRGPHGDSVNAEEI